MIPRLRTLSSRKREESRRRRGGGSPFAALLILFLSLTACSSDKPKPNTGLDVTPDPLLDNQDVQGSGGERCNADQPGREVSAYDTSGDQVPDVRKVYLSIGSGVDERLVVICRETDLNSDGVKDVIRYYDDEGRTTREESDRNFDGKMDIALVFQDGVVVRRELDENRDGNIDLKIYYENGEPLRAERDVAGRSTPENWQPDRWEYYVDGKLVRMGIDLDGDSKVDRWDRDASYKRPDLEPDEPEDPNVVKANVIEK